MEQKKIDKDYGNFMILKDYIPAYNGAEIFALGFKKFTLLKEVNTVYSDETAPRCTTF